MSLLSLIIVLSAIGFLMYLINSQVPMQPEIKQIINIVIIFAVVFWLLNTFHVLGAFV